MMMMLRQRRQLRRHYILCYVFNRINSFFLRKQWHIFEFNTKNIHFCRWSKYQLSYGIYAMHRWWYDDAAVMTMVLLYALLIMCTEWIVRWLTTYSAAAWVDLKCRACEMNLFEIANCLMPVIRVEVCLCMEEMMQKN